jgi:hypothetical protein
MWMIQDTPVHDNIRVYLLSKDQQAAVGNLRQLNYLTMKHITITVSSG